MLLSLQDQREFGLSTHTGQRRTSRPCGWWYITEATVSAIEVEVIEGDLLDQDVEVIVNAWNRNLIPWWLLLPQGVSGAIKQRGGPQPFRAVAKHGPIPLGHAVVTGSGTLLFKAIIHVAGINMLWRASERSIRDSVRN